MVLWYAWRGSGRVGGVRDVSVVGRGLKSAAPFGWCQWLGMEMVYWCLLRGLRTWDDALQVLKGHCTRDNFFHQSPQDSFLLLVGVHRPGFFPLTWPEVLYLAVLFLSSFHAISGVSIGAGPAQHTASWIHFHEVFPEIGDPVDLRHSCNSGDPLGTRSPY